MATINVSLAAGSVESPYFNMARITKQLCAKTTQTPVFAPAFSLMGYTLIGTGQYEALVNVSGTITFTPCGQCCAKSQTINQNFIIPFYSATTPASVTLAGGTPINSLVMSGCSKCSNTFVSDVPLTLTVGGQA